MRIAVVTAIPTPYRDPFWGRVNAIGGVELDVFYCAAGKPDRPWQVDWPRDFNYFEMPSWNLARFRGADASAYWVPGLQAKLRRGSYDAAIIGGYNHPCMLASMRTCRKRGVPFFLVCETHRVASQGRFNPRRSFVRWICRLATGGLPTGTLATRFLEAHGLPEDKTIRMPNVPDTTSWTAEVGMLRRSGTGLHDKLGVSDGDRIVTFVGRMIPKKRPDLLIRAFAEVDIRDSVLVLIGDGPLLAQCRELAASLGVADRVRFPGFCARSEIQEWFAVSRLFALPSTETWGVAGIEALASGLRVILSDGVGSHPDVVRNPSDGWVVPAGQVAPLVEALRAGLAGDFDPAGVVAEAAHLRSEFQYDVLSGRLVDGLRRISGVARSTEL